jgi:SprT-like family protein
VLTSTDFLREIRLRGAVRIRRVCFRNNRNTIWSLTQNSTVLNVHTAYGGASPSLLDAFALIAIERGSPSAKSRAAYSQVRQWPDLIEAIQDLRREHSDLKETRGVGRVTCCGTSEQQEYLRAVYLYFNRTRFDRLLPADIPIRLSHRMKAALGHMLPGEASDGRRRVTEIALNVDLLLPGNGAERMDTLLHEMAHAADYLESGGRGHGASWKGWACRVGCRPTTLYHRPVRFRHRRSETVTRVPPLPPALAQFGAHDG